MLLIDHRVQKFNVCMFFATLYSVFCIFRYPWMHSCTAYNHAYADSGVFCIHSSSHPSQLEEAVSVTLREFIETVGTITEEEFKVSP